MKNIKIAIFALTAALAVSPLAFGTSIPISISGTLGSFDLTGIATGGFVQSGGTFTQTVTNSGTGETPIGGVTFDVVAPIHKSFMGSNPLTKNDNKFFNTNNPFTADGLLIKLTSGGAGILGDYVYINGIGSLDTDQISVDVYSSSLVALSTIEYTVVNNDIPKTPEPSSMLLLGTGLLSLAGLVFWKSKSSGNSLPALTL